jgi:hypothetical protein
MGVVWLVGRKTAACCWVSLGFAPVERDELLRTAAVANRRVQDADTRARWDICSGVDFRVFVQDFCDC